MKRIVVLIMALVICFSLCACGKSEEMKNVEAQIATLNSDSTYEEIAAVYELYLTIPQEKRDRIENAETLSEYCSLENGALVLTKGMIDEIEDKFAVSTLGVSDAQFTVIYDFNVIKRTYDWAKEWDSFEEIAFYSNGQENDYTYSALGTIVIIDKQGQATTHELTVSYFAVFDENEESGYKIYNETIISEEAI